MTFAAAPAVAQTMIPIDVVSTNDSDDFESLRMRGGSMFDYHSPFHYKGVVAQSTRYTFRQWQEDAPGVLFLWRNQSRETLAGTIAEAGLVSVGGRTRLVGDATWSLRPRPRTGVELLAAADLVETRRALERGTAYAFAGVSVEQQLSERFTAIALAGTQRFTDGNDRLHLRGRLIWLLLPDQGVTAQLRWRQFAAGDLEVEPDYFNPETYREMQAALSIRKRYAGWLVYGIVAAGREEIDRNITNPTALVEFRTEGTLSGDVRLILRASYNRSAGFAITEDYWYRTMGITVIVPF